MALFDSEAERLINRVPDEFKEPYSLDEEQIKKYWDRRTRHLLPNSFCYIMNYKDDGLTNAMGMSLISSSYKYDACPTLADYLRHYIPEQKFLLLHEIRQVRESIFKPYAKHFKINAEGDPKEPTGRYAYFCDRTLEDWRRNKWHAQLIIEPLVFDDRNQLVSYFSTVHLCYPTARVPFRSRIDHINGKADMDSYPLNEINEVLSGIKDTIANKAGLSRDCLEDCVQKKQGKTDLQTGGGHKGMEQKEKDRLSGNVKRRRGRLNEKLKEHFPELTKSCADYSKVHAKKAKGEKNIGDTEFLLQWPDTYRILAEMGFITEPPSPEETKNQSHT